MGGEPFREKVSRHRQEMGEELNAYEDVQLPQLRIDIRRMEPISGFNNDNNYLSNYFSARVEWDGRVWPTVEHLYNARKCPELAHQEEIRSAGKPGQAKQAAYRLPWRVDWPEVRVEIMLDCVRRKFTQHPDLARKLKTTGDALLVEKNWWHDNFWGDCVCKRCIPKNGENQLGKILMQIRKEMRSP